MRLIQTVIYLCFSINLLAQPKQSSTTFPIEKSVNHIFLQDESTTIKQLGTNSWDKHFEADSMLPRIECINKTATEGLRLFFHYGGTKNSVAEFELLIISKEYKRPSQAISLNTS